MNRFPARLIYIFILSTILSVGLFALPEDPIELLEWERAMLDSIEKQVSVPPKDAIPKLGKWLLQLNNNNNREQGDRPVFTAARKMLLSIPGHAEYYRDKINGLREYLDKLRAEDASVGLTGPALFDLNNAQMYGFQTLSYLPSVETVQVLGEFLSDDRGLPDSPNPDEWTGERPNSKRAVKVLSDIGIANPPTAPMKYAEDIDNGLEAWRVWYQQVKDGQRTFRFVGDPVDYDLRGPSRRGAREPGVERAAKRPPVEVPATVAAAPATNGNSTMLPWLMALAMCALGVAFYIRQRRKATDG